MIPLPERRHLREVCEAAVRAGEAQPWPGAALKKRTQGDWASTVFDLSDQDWARQCEVVFARDLCRTWVERAVACFDLHLREPGRGWLLRAAEEEARVRGSPGAYCDLWWWVTGEGIAAPEERRRPTPRRWRPWR